MIYLALIFIPPIYFLNRKLWGALVLNSILYGTACLFLLTLIFAMVAPIFWILAVGHACWHLRAEMMAQQAELIASKMAEKMAEKLKGIS